MTRALTTQPIVVLPLTQTLAGKLAKELFVAPSQRTTFDLRLNSTSLGHFQIAELRPTLDSDEGVLGAFVQVPE